MEKVTIAVIPISDAYEVEEHKEIELSNFHFSQLGVHGEGMLVKDNDEVVVFRSRYNIMANFVDQDDPGPTDPPEYAECTITITNCEESLK